jgi:hypothetical protein
VRGPISWFGTSTDVTSRPIGMMATAYSWTAMERILKAHSRGAEDFIHGEPPVQPQTGKD